MRMNTTLVINPKGGAGKTTVAINLASHFAAANTATTLMDYDPQGSSLNWLHLRDPFRNRIYAANAAPQRGNRLRGIEMHVPADTRQLIIDAPAGASGLLLQEMLSRADCIVVPVAPSALRSRSFHTVSVATGFLLPIHTLGRSRPGRYRSRF